MDVLSFARAWAEAWASAWRTHDAELVGSLYAGDASFRSMPFRTPHVGGEGAADYAAWAFQDEAEVRCWFSDPYVAGDDRAAVEYWAISTDHAGVDATIAGVALLRFGDDGRVLQQRDYWTTSDGRVEPYGGWERTSP